MKESTRGHGRLRKGTRVGKYELIKRMGLGAFAEVWKAKDMVEKRSVALKIALSQAVEEYGRDEIEREARIAARLHHPNILAIRNADWYGGRFFIASELAKTNLAEYPAARRSPRIAMEIIQQIASALAFAHSQRIMHRDVKPPNILVFPDGRSALGDFGASCFAKPVGHTYSEVGTLGYLAPEQAYGRPGFSSDVFSLGVIAYELLTGFVLRWPFEWPPPGYSRLAARVPETVIPVLRKAVAFQPKRRYRDAIEFHEALTRALARAENHKEKPKRRKTRKKPPSPLQVESEHFRRRHGSRLGMRFLCNRCEGPVAEEMMFCPWCGTDDNSFREITSYPLVCYSCERGVRPEWKYCPWCYAGRFTGNGKLPRKDPKAVLRCRKPGCPGELRPFMRYCPMCKTKPRRTWSDRELGERCPRCRWPASKEFWRFCPWCGRREQRAGRWTRR